MIVLGLKGMQIEQHAQEVMAYCAQLQKDFGTFRADFDTIGKHLGHARSKYAEAERRLDRFESKLDARPSRRSSRRPKWPSSRARSTRPRVWWEIRPPAGARQTKLCSAGGRGT